MKKNCLKIMIASSLVILAIGGFLPKQLAQLGAQELKLPSSVLDLSETAQSSEPLLETDSQFIGPLQPPVNSFAHDELESIWPGQEMMKNQFGLSDDKWVSESLTNATESLSVFDIDVKGFEGLKGHIRLGGVDEGSMTFIKDTTKQVRNLVFVVEDTNIIHDKDRQTTKKYTYNYSFGSMSTYTFTPITDGQIGPTVEDTYSFEVTLGGSTQKNRPIVGIYTQKMTNGKTAVKVEGKPKLDIYSMDFYTQNNRIIIPNNDGGVRIVNEVVNTGWKNNKANEPRKAFGVVLGEDTKLNAVDDVPMYSLGTNKGIYIANKNDLFRVSFPRVAKSDAGATNYEGQWHNSVFSNGHTSGSKAFPAFQRLSTGVGNESQILPLDQRVWPVSKYKPDLRPVSTPTVPLTEDEQGWDTQYVQKWEPRMPPEEGEKAIFAYDVNVLPIFKPEIKLTAESLDQKIAKEGTVTFKGQWQDQDSLNVSLYYRIGSDSKGKWVKFSEQSREDTDLEKEKWFDFDLTLDASLFKEAKPTADTITFKAVDTTNVESNHIQTTVSVLTPVTIAAEHYIPDMISGYKLKETISQQKLPGERYQTVAQDYQALGFVLDKVVGEASAITPYQNLSIKYYYKEGPVTVIAKYLKEDGQMLFGDIVREWPTNIIYTTDSQEDKANNMGYVLEDVIGEPEGSTGKVSQTITVIYNFRKGVLGIVEKPSAIDFGANHLILYGSKDIYPTVDVEIGIRDELKAGWNLNLKILEPLKGPNNQLIKGKLMFNKAGLPPLELNLNSQAIFERQKVAGGDYQVKWDASQKEGLYLQQLPGNRNGGYQGKLEWNLELAP